MTSLAVMRPITPPPSFSQIPTPSYILPSTATRENMTSHAMHSALVSRTANVAAHTQDGTILHPARHSICTRAHSTKLISSS